MEKTRYDPELRGAGTSWTLLMLTIAALEGRNETLSNGFARANNSDNPLIRYGTRMAAVATLAHLMDFIPEKVDPFDKTIGVVRKFIGKE